MIEEIVLIGGGGHCQSCIDVIESAEHFRIAGIVDSRQSVGAKVLGYPIIGSDDDLTALSRSYQYFCITVGQTKSPAVREAIAGRLSGSPAQFPVIISPTAHVSKRATLGPGCVVMHHALVNTNAQIGAHCILNSGCIIEHGVQIGDFSHVSTGASVNGDAKVGRACFVGSNATIREGLRLTDGIVLGAGAVALSDGPDPGTYVGVPARRVNHV
jgi:sugar O-acyltransferase (sialic acid O-acetyltransferase NeuD family)